MGVDWPSAGARQPLCKNRESSNRRLPQGLWGGMQRQPSWSRCRSVQATCNSAALPLLSLVCWVQTGGQRCHPRACLPLSAVGLPASEPFPPGHAGFAGFAGLAVFLLLLPPSLRTVLLPIESAWTKGVAQETGHKTQERRQMSQEPGAPSVW